MSAAKSARTSPVCDFDNVGGWTDSVGDGFQGFVCRRPMDDKKYQADVDRVVRELGGENECQFETPVKWSLDEPDCDGPAFEEAVNALLPKLAGLPAPLRAAIKADALLIGTGVLALLRTKQRAGQPQPVVSLKIEAFGLSICSKWHHDNYIGRALTAYCGPGTEYTTDENIDWEDKCCLPAMDESKIERLQTGDIIFMKGRHFPSRTNALTHRSPAPVRAPDGVKHRLLLKVDMFEGQGSSGSSAVPPRVQRRGVS